MVRESAISLPQAASLALSKLSRPILTAYSLGILVFKLCAAGAVDGQRLRLKITLAERRHYRQVLEFFLSHGVLIEVRGFPRHSTFTAIAQPEASGPELICTVDPFAYVSHLSAMEIHGLTDRLPQTLTVSSPPSMQWRQFADERMRKDLGIQFDDYLASGLPRLQRTHVDKVRGQPLHLIHSVHLGAFKVLEPNGVRVATLGRTFLDMLREPDLCGGIQHVLDVYQNFAKRYLGLIVAEVDQHGNAIDKVRAGYVLQELCRLEADSFTSWLTFAKRGGSRKLVAKNPYSATFSPNWCLSLNMD
jgi:predicted transcriptional regulator of viral defense system